MDAMKVGPMQRRRLVRLAGTLPLVSVLGALLGPAAVRAAGRARVRPGEPAWPSEALWGELRARLKGALISVSSPLQACVTAPSSPVCGSLWKSLKNPYFIGDDVS